MPLVGFMGLMRLMPLVRFVLRMRFTVLVRFMTAVSQGCLGRPEEHHPAQERRNDDPLEHRSLPGRVRPTQFRKAA
jgi:hypothetical protein